MTCSEFLSSFSDVQDGSAPAHVARAADEHLAACPSCSRYRRVVERGVDLLRTLPAPAVNEDFVPRLGVRLRLVDEDARLRSHANSGSTALAVLAMAVLLTAVAWAPALQRPATVDLPPIVVSRPPAVLQARTVDSFTAFARNALGVREGSPLLGGASVRVDLWGDARTALFQYSRLARRYGQQPPQGRSGLDQDR